MVKPTENELEPHTREVLSLVESLPDRQRELLVSHLIQTQPSPWDDEPEAKDEGYDEAWEAEIRRRLDEIDQGTAKMVPWSQLQRELRGIISGEKRPT